MEDKTISEQESMAIIQQMIRTAKKEQKDDGKGWIIWGWLLFLVSVLTYVNLQTKWVEPFFFWTLFGFLTLGTLIFMIIKVLFLHGNKKVRTYTRDLFEKLNIGFFIFVIFIIFAMNLDVGVAKGFSFLIALYGFWILIYGTALNFRPSVIAAYITWAIAFTALFTDKFSWIMLLHAAAVLCGYIIPGHMAYIAFKKAHQSVTA